MTPDLFADMACISDALAADWWQHVDHAMAEFGITDRVGQAAFIANCSHESRGFQKLEESLLYRDPARLVQVWPTRFTLAVVTPQRRDARKYINAPFKLAEYVYGGRGGNRPEGSGDGWNNRGSGILQITFHDNLADCEAGTGISCVDHPELLRTDKRCAARAAAWFWVSRKLDRALHTAGGFQACCSLLNTGRIDTPSSRIVGYHERLAIFNRALEVSPT